MPPIITPYLPNGLILVRRCTPFQVLLPLGDESSEDMSKHFLNKNSAAFRKASVILSTAVDMPRNLKVSEDIS